MPEVEKVVEKVEDEQNQYSETELKAMEEGWIPPDRFDKDEQGKEFISAEKYLENGSFFKKINALKQEVESTKKTLANINEHHRKVQDHELKKMQHEYEERISALKAEKIKALDEGDSQRVVDIDEQILNTARPQVPAPVNSDAVLSEWKRENTWYEKDEFLADEADILASQYAHRGIPLEAALVKIKNHLTTKFPERFENKQRSAAPAVEGGGSPKPATSQNVSAKNLSTEERQVYDDFKRMGIFKTDAEEKKYLQDVIKLRG